MYNYHDRLPAHQNIEVITSTLYTYLPQDRYRSLQRGASLPALAQGAALFADISGFTPLTEALTQSLGARRGIEELTRIINAIYQPLNNAIEQFGGSVISFAGDSIICWFDEQDSRAVTRAATCALSMQQVMQAFENITLKIAITSGIVHRMVVGNPEIQLMDTLAGATVTRLAAGEHLAKPGEVLLDEAAAQALGDMLISLEGRYTDTGQRFAILASLKNPYEPIPKKQEDIQVEPEVLRSWTPPVVFEREHSGLGGFLTEMRPAVALFLRFTGIDYDHDNQAQARLNAFIGRVQEILVRYEGNLIQLTMGDKGSYLYSTFGVPVAHEDDALRAVMAAWEFNLLPDTLGTIAPVQIGISKGIMRAGAYGSPTRQTYGVLGDDTNLAARLMSLAQPGEILVSGRVQQLIGDNFYCDPRPPMALKGKAEPLPVFAISDLRRRQAIRFDEPGYTLPMMGRKAELDVFQEKLALVQQGQGQVIGICAEAGMGKSRLIAEAIRMAQQSGFASYGGSCEAFGVNTAYLAWRPIWQAFFNIELASSPRRQLRNLELEVEDRAPARMQAIPVLSTLLNMDIDENDFTSKLEPEDRLNVLTALLEDCLKSAARETPLLFVLEDIHWIDPLSHDLFESLARICLDLPVCFLCAYRPPNVERLQKARVEALPNFTRLDLSPLNAVEAELMIRAKLAQLYPEQSAKLPPSFITNIADRAEGNPFYVEELLNYLRDRGLNPYHISDLELRDLPSSIHSLILSRIDQLTETQKITLKVASIIGRLFLFSWLQGYYPSIGKEANIKRNLSELARLDLTVMETPEPELAYFFKHILTRDVAYESMSYTTRARLHEQLAQYIETIGESGFLDLIAYHYGLSENKLKQIEFFQKAGNAAKESFANEAALDYYERLKSLLVEPDAQIEMHINRGDILKLTGKFGEAETEYRAALALGQPGDNTDGSIRCQQALGELSSSHGDYKTALEWLEAARTGSTAIGNGTIQARAYIEIGRIYKNTGDFAKAQEFFVSTLDLAHENKDPLMEADAYLLLCAMHREVGEYPTAERYANDCLKIMTAIGYKKGQANSLNEMGLLSYGQGNLATGQVLLKESLSICREIGYRVGSLTALNNLANIATREQNYAEAQAIYEECLAGSREMGYKYGIANALINLGMVAADQLEFQKARLLYEESLAQFRDLGNKQGITTIQINLGYIECEQENYTRARGFLEDALAKSQELESKWGIVYSLIGLAVASAGQGDYRSAARMASVAEVLRSSINLVLDMDGSRLYERAVALCKQALSEVDFRVAWEDGTKRTVSEILGKNG